MTITDKIKQAIIDEFKHRASHGRAIYTIEEVLYIVNEVIDAADFEKDDAQKQLHDMDLQILIIKGDLKYLAEKVNKLSSLLEEHKKEA